MTSQKPSSPDSESKLPFKPLGFVAGLAGGILLMLVILLLTEAVWMALLFGLAPGIIIGMGLQLTARK